MSGHVERAYAAETERLDRAQRAREAYWDDMRGRSMRTEGIEAAIEAATRVRVTPEIIAVAAEFAATPGSTKGVCKMLAAAFAAAGFEVVE